MLPMGAATQLAEALQMHTDALQLALQAQHGVATALTSASGEMVSRQQRHAEQLDSEIDALRQIQSSFQHIGQDISAAHASIGSLLHSRRSGWTVLRGAVLPLERLIYWALTQLAHGSSFGSSFNHCEFGLSTMSASESAADIPLHIAALAWQCLHWLFPALLTGLVLLARLHKKVLVFFYFRVKVSAFPHPVAEPYRRH